MNTPPVAMVLGRLCDFKECPNCHLSLEGEDSKAKLYQCPTCRQRFCDTCFKVASSHKGDRFKCPNKHILMLSSVRELGRIAATLLCLVVGALGLAPVAAAQEPPDLQEKITLHKQIPLKDGMGLAFWGIVPDLSARQPFRGIVLGGWFVKREKRTVEILGGALIRSEGKSDPILDLRYFEKGVPRLDIFAEPMYLVNSKKLLVLTSATTPLPKLGRLKLNAGAESDVTIDVRSGNTAAGFGPLVTVPLPICGKGRCRDVVFAASYQHVKQGQSFVRLRLSINF